MKIYTQYSLILQQQASLGPLYLGSAQFAHNYLQLNKLNIKTVVSIMSDSHPKYQDQINHLVITKDDYQGQSLLDDFQQIFEFIDNGRSKGGVLIHCMQGVSRSATLAIAYVMRKWLVSFQRAYEIVRQERPVIHPNFGFIQQLKGYQKEISKLKKMKQQESQKNMQ